MEVVALVAVEDAVFDQAKGREVARPGLHDHRRSWLHHIWRRAWIKLY